MCRAVTQTRQNPWNGKPDGIAIAATPNLDGWAAVERLLGYPAPAAGTSRPVAVGRPRRTADEVIFDPAHLPAARQTVSRNCGAQRNQPNERDCHDHHARLGRPKHGEVDAREVITKPFADDLGKLISFLASGPTAFLTGDTIKIDGGALVSAGV